MGLFDKLIFNQVKRRELVLQQEGPGVEAVAKKIKLRPFITISRESGSGGTPIAKLVAKKLQFKFYNKKLINLIANKTKKRKNNFIRWYSNW